MNRAARSSARQRGQNGNAVMEFAIVMFPFFALIFGILSITYAIFLRGVMQNAAREGVRWAITFNRGTFNGTNCSSSQSDCIKKVVQTNSFGFLSGTNVSYIHIDYYAPFRLNTPIAAGDLPITSTDANYPNVQYMNQTNNVVEVSVQGYPMLWLAPFPGYLNQQAFTINTYASDVLQGYGVDSAGNAYNSPPTP
ncbi:MAG TPA: TadE family protein [Bryobacteraceae bacterium]|nr:TadE family protein [Bryobacteraceae bacterium]